MRRARAEQRRRIPARLPAARVDLTVWFTLRRGSEVTIKADTAGSDFGTVLVAYEQTGSGTGGLVEVAFNDETASDNRSEITFTAAVAAAACSPRPS
jgi:hypothetical protein